MRSNIQDEGDEDYAASIISHLAVSGSFFLCGIALKFLEKHIVRCYNYHVTTDYRDVLCSSPFRVEQNIRIR